MMDSADVVVVGGGPAGSSCAGRLVEAGLDVLVLDKAAFPRDKTCAGWITPPVLESLRIDPADYGQGRVFQPITTLRTAQMGGPLVETRYESPASYGIRRCEFDHYLLCRSRARVRTGTPARTLRRDAGAWIVNEEVRAPLLIGAGGHFCPVARFLHPGSRAEPVVAAQEVEFRMREGQERECAAEAGIPELYFCPDWKGYGWCFRKGPYLNVGLGRQDSRELHGHVHAFVDSLQQQGRIPRELPGPWRGHAYLLHETAPRTLFDEGVLLVGDAAGLAYSQSGEGIRTAVESGLLAARTVLAARGRYGREDLQTYRERVEERFGPRRPLGGAARLLATHLVPLLGARLLSSPWFSRHVLLDRWFLHARQAALAPEAA